jgi:hypothetical protein
VFAFHDDEERFVRVIVEPCPHEGGKDNREVPAMPTPSRQEHPMPSTPGLASYLEDTRRKLRAQFTVEAITLEERQIDEDEDWALQDPEVQATYQGEFVVPYLRKIVVHGHNAAEVLQEAARITGRRVEDLPLVGIVSPLCDIPH